MKFCPSCGRDLVAEDGAEDSAFTVHSRRGEKVVFYPQCRACTTAERRIRRLIDPTYARRERQRQRAAQRRWLSDPANAEYVRSINRERARRAREEDREGVNELARMQYRLRQERKGISVRPGPAVVDGTQPRVPSEPFRRWLIAYMTETETIAVEAVARKLELVPLRVRSVLNRKYERVALDVVDRALMNSEVLVRLDGREILRVDDLYPLDEEATG